MQILPQIKAQIFADCKTKRKKLRKQKRKNNRKIPLAPYSFAWKADSVEIWMNFRSFGKIVHLTQRKRVESWSIKWHGWYSGLVTLFAAAASYVKECYHCVHCPGQSTTVQNYQCGLLPLFTEVRPCRIFVGALWNQRQTSGQRKKQFKAMDFEVILKASKDLTHWRFFKWNWVL